MVQLGTTLLALGLRSVGGTAGAEGVKVEKRGLGMQRGQEAMQNFLSWKGVEREVTRLCFFGLCQGAQGTLGT